MTFIENIHDLPQFCLSIVEQLESQPLFEESAVSVLRPCKVLLFEDYDCVRICGIINKNASKILGRNAWNIHEFNQYGSSSKANGSFMQHGLYLYVGNKTKARCSPELLKRTYTNVVDRVRSGWKRSENLPHNFYFDDDPHFNVYVKETPMIEEEILIRFLGHTLSIKDADFICHAVWERHPHYTGRVYLRIRKEILPTVIERFGFEFV